MGQIKSNKIKFVQETLLKWFSSNGRDFPWRKKNINNYKKIIAEVLLQRTRAETVAIYFPRFLSKYPSWESITNSKRITIESFLKPFGLYKLRSRQILKLSSEIVKKKGRFPRDLSSLLAIPGIGQYNANAIMLLVHEKPFPLIDVNMARFVERIFGPRKLADIRDDPFLQKLCLRIVNHKKAKEINWAILDFAALVCRKREPLCFNCIFKMKCIYYKQE